MFLELTKEELANVSIVTYLHQHGADIRANEDVMFMNAVKYGHLATVKYLHENGCVDGTAVTLAAKSGHLNIIEFLYEYGIHFNYTTNEDDSDALIAAAERGYLEIVEYLTEHGIPVNETAIQAAVDNGHLNILKYLHAKGGDISLLNVEFVSGAALNGHLHILEYLHEERGADIHVGGDDCLSLLAAEGGHLHIIRYLLKNGVNIPRPVMWTAASYGHMDLVKYFYNYWPNSYSDHSETLNSAAIGGHLNIVTWLYSKGIRHCDMMESINLWMKTLNPIILTPP